MSTPHTFHLRFLTQLLKRKLSRELNWWSKQASRVSSAQSLVPATSPHITHHASAKPSRKSTMFVDPVTSRSGRVSPVGFFAAVKQGLKQKARKSAETGPCQDAYTRLFRHAEELKKKKQTLRETFKVHYSFRPQLAANTQKWLNLRMQRKCKAEEVAVVSSCGSAALGFFRSQVAV